ncbi:MAG: ATP-NAD kinase family protein [Thermoproteota archaeon]
MKLGLIVNPIAGMGGRVGLKGTDGVVEEALKRGADPVAPDRGIEFLEELKRSINDLPLKVFTCPGKMGEEECKEVTLPFKVLDMNIGDKTTAEDTKTAVELMANRGVDLIIFVGGDGTARDIFDALQKEGEIPVLGVPSGVKMYSGIFAVNPSDAVEVISAFAQNQTDIAEFEIMDADENAIREDSFSIHIYGYLKAPFLPMRVQGGKKVTPSTVDEKRNQTAIARFIIEEMTPEETYLLGPGTTVKCITEMLGLDKTLLGVDIYKGGEIILDVNEKRILEEVDDWKNTWIILSPIGHQGILLGRGNQQISPRILRKLGKSRIITAATKGKIQSIEGGILRVDTADEEVDKRMRGYIKVITDYGEWRVLPVQ